jgi:hypothetical protein
MPITERIATRSQFNPKTGCHEWNAKLLTKSGYGRIWYQGKQQQAHRVVWLLMLGHIPDGLFVCHTCDNRRCVTLAHLFLGTNADNMRDMARKGRARPGPGRKFRPGNIPHNKKLKLETLNSE